MAKTKGKGFGDRAPKFLGKEGQLTIYDLPDFTRLEFRGVELVRRKKQTICFVHLDQGRFLALEATSRKLVERYITEFANWIGFDLSDNPESIEQEFYFYRRTAEDGERVGLPEGGSADA
ncbi:hypothetical protein IFO70_00015 [Phormidium tenue FACHB-886]|nr:hypothetical protein [Phormidium tenue FACHB-886]